MWYSRAYLSVHMLNLFQFQDFKSQKSGTTLIEKVSRQQNESRRIASKDLLFIHWHSRISKSEQSMYSGRVMSLTEEWNGWILDENLVNPLARLVASERNSCLRLGKTREHCLSKRVTSPTAAIILSMMSCGMSIDFAIYALVCYSFDECKCKLNLYWQITMRRMRNESLNALCPSNHVTFSTTPFYSSRGSSILYYMRLEFYVLIIFLKSYSNVLRNA